MIYESMIDAHHGIAGKFAFHCAATFKHPLHIRNSQLSAHPSHSPRCLKQVEKHEDLKPRLVWGGFRFFSPRVMSTFFAVGSWPCTPKFLSSSCIAKECWLQVSPKAGKTCRLKENATLGLKQSLYMTAVPCRCSHSMSFLFASQKWLCLSRSSESAGKSRALKYCVRQY